MILHTLFPIFTLIALGGLLRRFHLIGGSFLKQSDRMVYYILFPVLLFWKIGGAENPEPAGFHLTAACALAVVAVFLLSVVLARIFSPSPFVSGAFTQCCYRGNIYIGLALVLTAYGEKGVRTFGILIGLIIVMINLLAVFSLTWYSRDTGERQNRVWPVIKAVFSNPLILSCLAGVLYSKAFSGFPLLLENTFKLTGMAALPLALISVGAVLFTARLSGRSFLLVLAVAVKLVATPALGLVFLNLLGVTGLDFKIGMLFLALPTAPSTYVFTVQMKSDGVFATAGIAATTACSALTLSALLLWMG